MVLAAGGARPLGCCWNGALNVDGSRIIPALNQIDASRRPPVPEHRHAQTPRARWMSRFSCGSRISRIETRGSPAGDGSRASVP